MFTCTTPIHNKSLNALAHYHLHKQKPNPKKRFFSICLGVFLTLLCILNTYGYWLKYQQTGEILTLLRSSVLILLSAIIIFTNLIGPRHRLYQELKHYFASTNTTCIDYAISADGIQMTINGNTMKYDWDSIETLESDSNFFYFTSSGKHSLIAKETLTAEQTAHLEKLFQKRELALSANETSELNN